MGFSAYPPLEWQEWLQTFGVLALGLLCYLWGMRAGRRSARARNGAAALGVSVAVSGAAAHYPPARDLAGPFTTSIGGESVLACVGALTLLGVAWNAQPGSAGRAFPAIAAALVGVVLAVSASGALQWRYLGRARRANYPDARGLLQQTTGMTCAPAAAAMLLARYGIRASEGELAELSNTTPITGTGAYALAQAVDRVARMRGMRGWIRCAGYEQAVHLARPFVAYVHRPGIGGHAILVEKMTPMAVRAADPLSGEEEEMTRQQFETEWNGLVIGIE